MLGTASKCAGATPRAQVSGRCTVDAVAMTNSPGASLRCDRSTCSGLPLRCNCAPSAQAIVSGPRSGGSGACTTPSNGAPSRSNATGIHEPDPAGPGARGGSRFLADEGAIDEAAQRLAQAFLDLLVDGAVAALAARTAGAIELGAQPLALGLDGGDHFGKRQSGHLELPFIPERLSPCLQRLPPAASCSKNWSSAPETPPLPARR